MSTSKRAPKGAGDSDSHTKKKTCFFIAPIGDEHSEARKWSDEVFRVIVEPAANELGYTAIRADQHQGPGVITTQVIQYCKNADIVVADLSDHNPNVFYELAVRHAVGKPVVPLIKKGEQIPFDVNIMRTLSFDRQSPSSFLDCRNTLSESIRAIEQGTASQENPITIAIGVLSLDASENPLEKVSSQIVSLLQEIKSGIAESKQTESTRRYFGLTTSLPTGIDLDSFTGRMGPGITVPAYLCASCGLRNGDFRSMPEGLVVLCDECYEKRKKPDRT